MMSIDICLSPWVDVITRIELFSIDLIGKHSHFLFSEMEMEMDSFESKEGRERRKNRIWYDSDYIPHGVTVVFIFDWLAFKIK